MNDCITKVIEIYKYHIMGRAFSLYLPLLRTSGFDIALLCNDM